MKTALCLLILLLTKPLSASTIPQYQISDIQGKSVITFSNDAILEVIYKDFLTVKGWDTGDIIELISPNINLFTLAPKEIIDGRSVIPPVFLLRNLTKNDEEATVWLREPPPSIDSDTFSIMAIDLDNRSITLNNATVWFYQKEDQPKVSLWEIGELIMIGRHNTIFTHFGFDSILLNTSRQSLIRTIEQ